MWEVTKHLNFAFHPDPYLNYTWNLRFWNISDWILLSEYNYWENSYMLAIKPIWTSFIPIISVSLLSLFILTLGLILPQKPKFIKFLNIVAALYILVILYTLSFDHLGHQYYRHDFSSENSLDLLKLTVNVYNPDSFTFNWYPNGSFYSNLFFIVASLTLITLLWGIADRFYSRENNKIEFLLLTIFIYVSAIILLSSSDFICALILLECITFCSYVLVGFERKNKFSGSSGIKYLILGSVPGGFFVLGVTLLYKNYGSFFLNDLEHIMYDGLTHFSNSLDYLNGYMFEYMENITFEYDHVFLSTYVAIILIFANLLFKLTAAPLHMWAPSIYGGAPLATTTFLSIFSKLTIIFFSIYLYISVFHIFSDIINILLIICGMISIYFGILGAFSEKLIKRFFVYSSMGHVGFMIIGIAVADIGLRGAINYLLVYVISSFILWFTVMYLTRRTTHLTSLKGLCINHPVLSIIVSITMFSLSGIPPLAGFFVKFEIFKSVLQSGYYSVVLILFILTVFSFFYYLRIIKIMYFENSTTFRKNKNQDLIKLRLISVLVNFLLFFVIFVPESFLIIVERTIDWLCEVR